MRKSARGLCFVNSGSLAHTTGADVSASLPPTAVETGDFGSGRCSLACGVSAVNPGCWEPGFEPGTYFGNLGYWSGSCWTHRHRHMGQDSVLVCTHPPTACPWLESARIGG